MRWRFLIAALLAAIIVVIVVIYGREPSPPTPPVVQAPNSPPDTRFRYVPVFGTSPCTLAVIDQQTKVPSVALKGYQLTDNSWTGETAINKAGTRLYLVNYSGSLTIIDISDSPQLRTIRHIEVSRMTNLPSSTAQLAGMNSICLNAPETRLFVGCNGLLTSPLASGGIAIFDLGENDSLTFNSFVTNPSLNGVEHVFDEPANQFLYATNYNASPATIAQYSLSTQTVTNVYQLPDLSQQLLKIAHTRNGLWLYAVAFDPTVTNAPLVIVDTTTGQVIVTELKIGNRCIMCTLSLDNDTLFVLNSGPSPTVCVIDVSNRMTPKLQSTLTLDTVVSPGAIAVDDRFMTITDSASNNITLYSPTAPFKLVAELDVGGFSYGL